MNTERLSGEVRRYSLLKFLVIFCIIFTVMSSCGRVNEKKMADNDPPSLPPAPPKPPSMVGSDTIWNFPEQQPRLPGNEEALYDYISRNLRYPDSAKNNGVQGKVVVRFSVSRKGNVGNYETIQRVSPLLDAEALRVIKTITRFEPGYQQGQPVAVWYEVPISFKLK